MHPKDESLILLVRREPVFIRLPAQPTIIIYPVQACRPDWRAAAPNGFHACGQHCIFSIPWPNSIWLHPLALIQDTRGAVVLFPDFSSIHRFQIVLGPAKPRPMYRHGISWVETPRLSAQRLNDFLFSLCVHAGYIFRHILHLKGEAINLPDRLDSAGSSPTTFCMAQKLSRYTWYQARPGATASSQVLVSHEGSAALRRTRWERGSLAIVVRRSAICCMTDTALLHTML